MEERSVAAGSGIAARLAELRGRIAACARAAGRPADAAVLARHAGGGRRMRLPWRRRREGRAESLDYAATIADAFEAAAAGTSPSRAANAVAAAEAAAGA